MQGTQYIQAVGTLLLRVCGSPSLTLWGFGQRVTRAIALYIRAVLLPDAGVRADREIDRRLSSSARTFVAIALQVMAPP